MADFAELLELIKKTALGAVEASDPVKILFGTVSSVNPLVISIEQKSAISEEQLILTRSVTESGLEIGEKVVMLRMQGGQKFLVIDRLGVP